MNGLLPYLSPQEREEFASALRAKLATSDLCEQFISGLQPKQLECFDMLENSPVIHGGYGGARGGGKSELARRVLLYRRAKYAGTNGILIRRTYEKLYKNHIEPMFREWPFLRGWWSAERRELNFPNGSKMYFSYAEHEKDVEELFQGPEYGDICPEETGQFSDKEISMMRGANRWTKTPGFTPKMLYPFNPGGRSHFYLKRIFVDKDYQSNERGEEYGFVQAYGWDNIEWARPELLKQQVSTDTYYNVWDDAQRKAFFLEFSEYGRMLDGMADEDLKKAWLEGSWDKFDGIVFPELSEDVHNLDNWDYSASMQYAKLIASIDYGGSGTTASVDAAIDLAENALAVNEYYRKNELISTHAQGIKQMLRAVSGERKSSNPNLHGNDYILLDPNTSPEDKQLAANGIFSVQDEYQRCGINTVVTHRSPLSVGINLIKEYLKVNPLHRHPFTLQMGSPRLFISKSRCPNLWREMKQLQREHNEETGKIEYVGSDHALDNLRYILMSRPSAPRRNGMDIDKLPPPQRFAVKAHDKWATGFDKLVKKSDGAGKSWW